MSLQVCTQGSFEGLSTLSTECLHVVFYCWQLKLNHSSPVIRQLHSLKFRLQSPDCRPMLMLVPSAKHLDLYAAPPQSRLVLFQIKPPLLSISTPTLSPAWSFVSLSLKTPPVELPPPPPKKKSCRMLATSQWGGCSPGKRCAGFQQRPLKGLSAATTKAAPRKHSPPIQKGVSFRTILPARRLLQAGRETSPWLLHVGRVGSLGLALAVRWMGHPSRQELFLDHVANALGEQLFFLTSLFCSLKNLRGRNSLASKQGGDQK